VTGADGAVANSYSYDQEGRVARREEAISNPFTYVGQYGVADDQNGLYHMKARYLSQETGRFMTQDPSGQEPDLNLYRYAMNNPVSFIDATGDKHTIRVYDQHGPYWDSEEQRYWHPQEVYDNGLDKLFCETGDAISTWFGNINWGNILGGGFLVGAGAWLVYNASAAGASAVTAALISAAPALVLFGWALIIVGVFVVLAGVAGAAELEPAVETIDCPSIPLPDPSGYVYEAVASNRLSDVTVTAFHGDMETPWDAERYDQANPLATDENGQYAWDVPFGQWRVKAEKAGYETAYSEWLPVPPPQTEVNIGMVSKAAPHITGVQTSESNIKINFDKYMDTETLTKQTIRLLGFPGDFDIVFANAEADPSNPDAIYASVIRLIPKSGKFPSGAQLRLSIAASAKSYAGAPIGAEYETVATVPGNPATPPAAPTIGPSYAWRPQTSPAAKPAELAPFKPLPPNDKDGWQKAADALFKLGLLAGTDASKPVYELEKELSRMESLAFAIRLMGLEKEAQGFTGANTFTDTPAWGDKYSAYALSIGLTVGVNEAHTLFEPDRPVTVGEFSAFLLRVLKYREQDNDFAFEDAAAKAETVGILTKSSLSGARNATRGFAVVMMLNALFAYENRSNAKLLDSLVKEGAVAEAGAQELRRLFGK
jgi:RHS repeat-associated protein